MAQENVKINKKVYGTKSASEVIDRSFSELLRSKDPINVEKLFQLYNELFYDIPKEGDQSHTTLIIQSTDYVRDFIDPKDEQIDSLLDRIIELEEQLAQVNDTKEHPFFRNGTFLITPNGTVFFMQNGKARRITKDSVRRSMATNLGIDPDTQQFTIVDASTPNEIGNGPAIRSLSDLSNFEEVVPTQQTNFIETRTALQNVRVNAGQLAELQAILEDKEAVRNIGQASVQDLIQTLGEPQISPARNRSAQNRSAR